MHLSGHKVEHSPVDRFQLGNYRLKAGIWTEELIARTRRSKLLGIAPLGALAVLTG